MISCIIIAAAFALVYVDSRAIPDGGSVAQLTDEETLKPKEKSAGVLLAELKGIERWRQDALKKAFENPELAKNPKVATYLAALEKVDSCMFVYFLNLLESVYTLNHPEGKDLDTLQKATDVALEFNRNQDKVTNGIAEAFELVNRSKEEVPAELLGAPEIEVVHTAFEFTFKKLLEIFAQLKAEMTKVQESPYSRNYISSQLLQLLLRVNK